MSLQITITADGREYTCPAGRTIGDFMRERGFEPRIAVVEHNGRVLTPAERDHTPLLNGDRLKITRLVANA